MVTHRPVQAPLPDAEADRVFRALADATRRDIVRRTLQEPANVSQLAAEYDMSFAAVQKHVTVLEGAGLVRKTHKGRQREVRADPTTLEKVHALLDEFASVWHGRIGRLDTLLAEDESPS